MTIRTSRLQGDLLLVMLSLPRTAPRPACTLLHVHFVPLSLATSLLPPALLVLQPGCRVLLPAGSSQAESAHLLSQQRINTCLVLQQPQP